MAWVVQNMHEGPVEVRDLSLTFSGNQIRDLDLVGRENAERSNDIRFLMRNGYLREMSKDPYNPPNANLTVNLDGVQEQVKKANEATLQVKQAADALTKKLADENEALKQKMAQMELRQQEAATQASQKMDAVLEAVKQFAQQNPAEARAAAKAMKNIQEEQRKLDEMSDQEISTQSKIIDMKQARLKKNMDDIGATVAKDSNKIQEAMEAMDELNLGD